MGETETPIRNISDTARWMAVYRARESRRGDAVFHDPFAEKLAGPLGEQIAAAMPFAEKNSWPFVARTWAIDQMILEQVAEGTGMVINLAAGLDTRPYRMDLPSSLQWVEVDLPGILEYKESVLGSQRPACRLERVGFDLAREDPRRELFAELGARARRTLIVSEGLLVYLSEDQVGSLARDLHAQQSFRQWTIDLASPALLEMLRKKMTGPLEQAGLPLKFAPVEGPEFFRPLGWELQQARPALKVAAEIKRLSLFLRLIARISSTRFRANRPWSAFCLFRRV